MQDAAELIRAVAALMWPLIVVFALWRFRDELSTLLLRIRRGKFLGQEVELGQQMEELQRGINEYDEQQSQEVHFYSSLSHASNVPSPEFSEQYRRMRDLNDRVYKLTQEAHSSPKLALISVSVEIERELNEIVYGRGFYPGRRLTAQRAIHLLIEQDTIPNQLGELVDRFWRVRNIIVHGGTASDDDVIRALDYGITILETLQNVPREVNIVHQTGVPLFHDPECTNPLPDIYGVIVRTEQRPSGCITYRIFPTQSPNYYQHGKIVTWEWNPEVIVRRAWYRAPNSQDCKMAWDSSEEFIGRHRDEVQP